MRTSLITCAAMLVALAVSWPSPVSAAEPDDAPPSPPPASSAPPPSPATAPPAPPAPPAPAAVAPPPPPLPPPVPASSVPASPVQASAAPAPAAESGGARIRSGVVLGISVAGALGASSGYPADVKLQTPDYYGSTPLLPGTAGRLMVMGALTDYLSIGFFAARGTFGNSNWDMSTGGGGLRAEAFPLVSVCSCAMPKWFTRGFGVYGEAGVGGVTTRVKLSGNFEEISGIQSHLAIGFLQEFFAGKNFTFAPDLRYEVVASSSADKNALALGIRIAWYPGN